MQRFGSQHGRCGRGEAAAHGVVDGDDKPFFFQSLASSLLTAVISFCGVRRLLAPLYLAFGALRGARNLPAYNKVQTVGKRSIDVVVSSSASHLYPHRTLGRRPQPLVTGSSSSSVASSWLDLFMLRSDSLDDTDKKSWA